MTGKQLNNIAGPRVIVALDYASSDDALKLVANLNPELCRLKVGKELFTTAGPDIVRQLVQLGFDVFLDLKFHDIPHTVAKACTAAADLGVWMINVHTQGGPAMLAAAWQALDAYGEQRPKLIGVTILTSLGDDDLSAMGLQGGTAENVARLALLAKKSGLDGVVCSAQETTKLRASHGADFILVTPGIRPEGVDSNDQKRAVTPTVAIANGSDYLVIGRPVTQAGDPISVLLTINSEIGALTN